MSHTTPRRFALAGNDGLAHHHGHSREGLGARPALLDRIRQLTDAEQRTQSIPLLTSQLEEARFRIESLKAELAAVRADGRAQMRAAVDRVAGMEGLMRDMLRERDQWRANARNAEGVEVGTQTDVHEGHSPRPATPCSPSDLHVEVAAALAVHALCARVAPSGDWRWGALGSGGGRPSLRYTTRAGRCAWFVAPLRAAYSDGVDGPRMRYGGGGPIPSLPSFSVDDLAALVRSFAVDRNVRQSVCGADSESLGPSDLLFSLLASLRYCPTLEGEPPFLLAPPVPWPSSGDVAGGGVRSLIGSFSVGRGGPICVARHVDGSAVLIDDYAPMGDGHVLRVTAFDTEAPCGSGASPLLTSWVPMAVLDSQLSSYRVLFPYLPPDGDPPTLISLATTFGDVSLVGDEVHVAADRGESFSAPSAVKSSSHAALGVDLWLHVPSASAAALSDVSVGAVLKVRVAFPQYGDLSFPFSVVRPSPSAPNRFYLRSAEAQRWYSSLPGRPSLAGHGSGGEGTVDAVVRMSVEKGEGPALVSAISFVRPLLSPTDDAASLPPVLCPLPTQVNGVDWHTSTVVLSDEAGGIGQPRKSVGVGHGDPPRTPPRRRHSRSGEGSAFVQRRDSSGSYSLVRSFMAATKASEGRVRGASPSASASPSKVGTHSSRPSAVEVLLDSPPRTPFRRPCRSPSPPDAPSAATKYTAASARGPSRSPNSRCAHRGSGALASTARGSGGNPRSGGASVEDFLLQHQPKRNRPKTASLPLSGDASRALALSRGDAHYHAERRAEGGGRALAFHGRAFIEWLSAVADCVAQHGTAIASTYACAAAGSVTCSAMNVVSWQLAAASSLEAAKSAAFSDECLWRAEAALLDASAVGASAVEWGVGACGLAADSAFTRLTVFAESSSPFTALSPPPLGVGNEEKPSSPAGAAAEASASAFAAAASVWSESAAAHAMAYANALGNAAHSLMWERVMDARDSSAAAERWCDDVAAGRDEAVAALKTSRAEVAVVRHQLASAAATNAALRRRFAEEMASRDEAMRAIRRDAIVTRRAPAPEMNPHAVPQAGPHRLSAPARPAALPSSSTRE